MSTFPLKMKYPQNSRETIKCGPTRDGFFSYLRNISCEGHEFLTFINDDDYLKDEVYYFIGVHLIIPQFFSKVEVDPDTGDVINDIDRPIDIEINQLFAMGLRSPDMNLKNSLWDANITFDDGLDNCGKPVHSFIPDRIGTAAITNTVQRRSSNIHQLFFKFHNHYFVPFVLSNGQICYYAFESKNIIRDWVSIFKNEVELNLAINRPIEYNNMLRIPFSRDVAIIDS
ncbi:MAG: hypothetical protein AAGG75_25140 [Bacteroidota bacterium]